MNEMLLISHLRVIRFSKGQKITYVDINPVKMEEESQWTGMESIWKSFPNLVQVANFSVPQFSRHNKPIIILCLGEVLWWQTMFIWEVYIQNNEGSHKNK